MSLLLILMMTDDRDLHAPTSWSQKRNSFSLFLPSPCVPCLIRSQGFHQPCPPHKSGIWALLSNSALITPPPASITFLPNKFNRLPTNLKVSALALAQLIVHVGNQNALRHMQLPYWDVYSAYHGLIHTPNYLGGRWCRYICSAGEDLGEDRLEHVTLPLRGKARIRTPGPSTATQSTMPYPSFIE